MNIVKQYGVNWMQHANCKNMDTNLFFADDGHQYVDFALDVCYSCDVRTECLNYAMRHHIDDGLWGGLTPTQRRKLRHHVSS